MAVQQTDRQADLKSFIYAVTEMGNKYYTFIKDHGQYHKPQALPTRFVKGEKQLCFKNAFHLMMENEDLVYVEGIAINIIPTDHAWCIDRDGNVIDNTWDTPANCGYLGIPFDRKYITRAVFKRGIYGIIQDWENNYPLMSGKHGGPDVWLHKAENQTKRTPRRTKSRK